MTSPSDSQSPAERLYFDFAAKCERGEAGRADFEALCAANPSLASALRELASGAAAARGLIGKAHPQDLLSAGETGAADSAISEKRSAFFRRNRTTENPNASGFARSFQPGETIGDFTLVRFIGHGGMGQVWEARQNSMRRPVALKFILPGRADAQTLMLFEREARAGGKASHPNLVRTLARGQAEGIEWIAQELVVGSYSLRDAIEDFRRETHLPREYYRSVAELVHGIALGMEAAHAAGVIHRDLKPQNILIDSHDRPKVADFGLARVAGDSVLSNTGDFAGTYHYMSPEQVTAKRIGLDHRTDIFSLGVVMYELLTLSRPFDGDTTQKVAEAIVMIDPPDPCNLRAQCPRDLAVICAKAMQKRPDARYASMKELAEDIGRHLKNEPILARPTSQLEKARKWALRHPAASVGIAVGVSALVVISGVALVALSQADRAERGERSAKDNLALAERNADEARRNAEAERLARDLAQRNAEEAKANATAASIARDEATQKADDVLALSAQKDYDDLVVQADLLWPAHHEMIPRYEEWLRKARELIDGRPADESQGVRKRPSLAEHKAKLAELRRDALPLTEEQVRLDRESHPSFAEWQAKSAELLWRSRMLGIEPWPDAAAAEAELESEKLSADSKRLNALAWKLVDPKQPVYGQEVRALLLARRAIDLASQDKRAAIRDTHAWALYRNGKLEAALAEMEKALSESGGDELGRSSRDLEKAVQQWQGEEIAKRRERRESLAKETEALAAAVHQRSTFEYADPEKTWWDRQLRELVRNLEDFRDPSTGLMGSTVNPVFGWGMQKRYEFASSVREKTITGEEAKRRWEEAILAIAKSDRYRDASFPGGGLLTPQEGLLPLGADPQSGLWEFWHVQSGVEPERDNDGNLLRQPSGAHKLVEKGASGTGIVLVLIPGGTSWMGAQKTDPNGPNYDPSALETETVHQIRLSPYFLSKYEMTQGQWARFTGLNPSVYQSRFNGTVGIMNPVEQVSWLDCERVLRGLGLELPSEAQWEFACRAGTSSAWWAGDAKESLAEKVNLADQSYVAVGGPPAHAAWWPEFKDGYAVHAPVGRLAANAFGLHEVSGNIWEWCFDAYELYPLNESRDPRVDGDRLATRVYRGGGFDSDVSGARSALRSNGLPSSQSSALGVRPSMTYRVRY